jgi:hypothetical protein
MNSPSRILNRFAILYSVAFVALGLGPLATDASARGRSFPIEVTGTINSVDKASQTFTVQTEEPAKIITIGLRWDCKFKRDVAPAGADILKKGAYVRVSYFATIFSGNLAVEIEANPKPELVHGVIERIEPANRQITLRLNRSRRFVVRWAATARFINRGRITSPAKLREGTPINVSYYSPPFESKYAVKLETQPF